MILEEPESMSPSGIPAGPDPSTGEASPEVPNHEVEDLLTRLDASEAKAREHWERYLRTAAELENLRKRAQREVENAHRFALESFLTELLPVQDSLELGVSGEPDPSAADIRQGTELTLRLLTQLLAKRGVEAVDPEGAPFDPERHEAIATEVTPGVAPGKVLKVVQKGYILNGRLIRPARVIVSGSPGA
jgi:molecular chaperone GrpE